MKKFLSILLISTGLGIILFFIYLKFSPVTHIRSIHLVPSDAIYIIEISQPVNAWKQIQNSELWSSLRTNPFFSEVNENAQFVDSLLKNNSTIAEIFANQPLIISAHMTEAKNYDFLCLWSMHDVATKLGSFKKWLLSFSDYQITERKYKDFIIYELRDPKENSILYLSFIEDVLVASYTPKLIRKAIETSQKPDLSEDNRFIKIQNLIKGREYFSVYFNPRQFNSFLGIYMNDLGSLKDLHHTVDYSGFQVLLDGKMLDLKGYVLPKDSSVSLLTAMLTSGAGKRPSQNILSNRTAWFASLSFEDFLQFYEEFEMQMKKNPKVYAEHVKNLSKIEKFLKINIKKDFVSWISQEVCLVANKPADSSFTNPELIVYIHTNNIDNAKEKIKFILKQVKKRTKVLKTQAYEYKGFEIYHFQVRGLFKLLFGKLFQKFDMPYVTFIEDFAIFSLDELALQSIIDDYTEKRFLNQNIAFQNFIDRFKSQSSIFYYLHMQNFYPIFPSYVSSLTWQSIQQNEQYIKLLEQIGFEMTAENDKFFTKLEIN